MSTFIVDNLKGKTTANTMTVLAGHATDSTTTTNLEQGLAKVWINVDGTAVTSDVDTAGVRDSFNNSSFSDDGTGQTTITLTNPMNTATNWCVTQGATGAYPYRSKAESTTTHSLDTVSGSGNFSNGASNGMCSGDLA